MIVPGFNHRFPKEGEDDYLWSFADCQPRADAGGHSRLDRKSLLIETCCTSLDEARAAQARGADRIELCTDLSRGGFTPPRELNRDVVKALTIPVNVLIRPSTRESSAEGFGFSGEDFVYDESDLAQMVDDIEYCKTVGAAGIVVGALTPDGAIDVPSMRLLVAAAAPLPVTFHRAFDVCTENPYTALDKIISLGCARLLSSGQARTAWEGRNVLRLLVRRAAARLIVMPGCGVNSVNLADLAAATSATEFHGTKLP